MILQRRIDPLDEDARPFRSFVSTVFEFDIWTATFPEQ
jgi:hypothetical protein